MFLVRERLNFFIISNPGYTSTILETLRFKRATSDDDDCEYNEIYLRIRKHFPCFYRVIETRVEVWEKREVAWEHEHEVRVSPRNFEFLPNFHNVSITL